MTICAEKKYNKPFQLMVMWTTLLTMTLTVSAQTWYPNNGWKDSYSVDGKCYCDSNGYDHGLDSKIAPTPVGEMNVVQICEAIEQVLGQGPSANRIPYNDIQCGNGPANDASDEAGCPGRVDIGPAGCNQIGPRWDLESVFGPWSGNNDNSNGGSRLNRSGWVLSASHAENDVYYAIDGAESSRWATRTPQTPNPEQYIVISFPETETFNRIIMTSSANPNDYPRAYEVYISDDGINWGVPVISGQGSNATTTINFEPVSASHLKIQQIGSHNNNWWSIHEVNLYNNDDGGNSGSDDEDGDDGAGSDDNPNTEASLTDRDLWVLASSNNNSDVNQATDGNTGSRWDTNKLQSPGQTFDVNLTEALTFNRIVLDSSNSPNDYPREYEVYVSNDGSDWGTPITSGNGNGAITTIEFPTQTMQYIRIMQTGRDSSSWWSIHELTIHNDDDENPGSDNNGSTDTSLTNRTAWILSANENNSDVGQAIDGSTGSRWDTNKSQSPGQSFDIDLTKEATFNRIVLDSSNSPNDYPRAYEVYVSNDGFNWGDPVVSGAGNSAITTIELPTQTMRYIRIMQTGSDSYYWWSIHELAIYND